MDIFGNTDPKLMPQHFFPGAVHLHYPSAIPAEIRNQNFSGAPRHWYLDADFQCAKCHQEFTWTAGEQKTWFEEHRFWIDAYPKHCKKCRAKNRHLENLRKEYDSSVADAKTHGRLDQKCRMIEIIRELKNAFGSVPQRMNDHLELFEHQLIKAAQQCTDNTFD